MISDYQAISKTWFFKGKQRIIPTTGKHRGVKLLGILNYETGQVHCKQDERYDAQVFLEFLKEVVTLYPEGEIVMVLDNSRIHYAKLLKDFLGDTPRLQLVFLPPYSPEPVIPVRFDPPHIFGNMIPVKMKLP
jgi:putative transposase